MMAYTNTIMTVLCGLWRATALPYSGSEWVQHTRQPTVGIWLACGTIGEWNNHAGWRHNILKTHVIGQLECTPEYELFTTAMAKFYSICFSIFFRYSPNHLQEDAGRVVPYSSLGPDISQEGPHRRRAVSHQTTASARRPGLQFYEQLVL